MPAHVPDVSVAEKLVDRILTLSPERLPAVLETIERNAQAQERLISDLLDVSRIITGKFRLELRPMDMAGMIEEALAWCARASSNRRFVYCGSEF